MQVRRIMGVETEYAFTGLDWARIERGGRRDAPELIELARGRYPCLRDGGNGVFLQNGSRLYVDVGSHPELSCPEVTSPWDVVRYALAGDRILETLAHDYQAGAGVTEAVLTRCNVDYRSRTTWGMHESYLHKADLGVLPHQLLPFLASRVVYTGAGGFMPDSPGLEFVVSPRAFFMRTNLSGSSTSERPLYHTKDESLASGRHHRLHILGESTCSETATWLKVGATALVVAMIEGGLRPAGSIKLRSPVGALHEFSADPSCTVKVPLHPRGRMAASEIQRVYLTEAERHRHESFMPPWAEDVCQCWRTVLDRLDEGGAASVARTLDWGIKLALYRRHVEQRGFSWESLKEWTQALRASLDCCPEQRGGADAFVSLMRGVDGEPRWLSRSMRATIVAYLERRGVKASRLEEFCRMRQELFELDTRFGQVGPAGVFGSLDRAGVLDHHVAGVEDIESAVMNPPSDTRACLRAEWVRRLSRRASERYVCGWTGVWPRDGGRGLDLSDPFATEAHWRSHPGFGDGEAAWPLHVPRRRRAPHEPQILRGPRTRVEPREPWQIRLQRRIDRAIAARAPGEQLTTLLEEVEAELRGSDSEQGSC